MKVILNKDLSTLGEEGDVRDVARGYARNYLFPRGIALPYTPKTVKLFEARKDEIEARKAQKRQDALGIKEKLEGLELSITMPAGANGKLYGAVTSQTLADELNKQGFQVERKRIELAGNSIKNAGKYKAQVRLYENSSAEIHITVIGQIAKVETPQAQQTRPSRRHRDEAQADAQAEKAAVPADSTPEAAQAEPSPSDAAPVNAGQADAVQAEPASGNAPAVTEN
ncbi:MAG: 50S ribosomal protein L9 [Treponema sp.]|nr:50S ribosomal protein L9 [Treponema sp.]